MTESKLSVRPLGDRVIVKALPKEEKTASGVIIPDSAKEKPHQGTVMAIGSGRVSESGEKIPVSVSVGDRILYGKYSGTEVKIDGSEYLIIKEGEILAILA